MREDDYQSAGLLDDLLELRNTRVPNMEFPPINPDMDLCLDQMYGKLINEILVFVGITDEDWHDKAPKILYLPAPEVLVL